MKYQTAVQELERVLGEADKLDDPLAAVKVKAKAASLIWQQSPERARALFLNQWDFIERQKDKAFDQEEARTALLRYLWPEDAALANQLLQKLVDKTQGPDVANFDHVAGNDPEARRLVRLSQQLVDTDAALAARVLEQSLAHNTSPLIPGALAKLRESDPLLANYVAARALESFRSQPRASAVVGLSSLLNYIFPLAPTVAPAREVEASDENLRVRFMSVGYQVLKESLAETEEYLSKEQHLSAQSLRLRSIAQGLVAATLAALAPRYAPQLTTELNETSKRLLSSQPSMIVQAAQQQAAVAGGTSEETGEMSILPAIARAEFNKAQGLIDDLKDETKKKGYTQLLLKAQFKTYLAASELVEALKTAHKMEDTAQQILMLTEVAKAAHKKGDKTFAAQVLNNARALPVNSNLKGLHARALFSLAAESVYISPTDATLTLQEAVKQVNSLADTDKDLGGLSRAPRLYANNPARFADSAEMMKAFATLSAANLEDTLLIAGQLENKAAQLVARLSAIEKTLNKPPSSTAPKPKVSSPAAKPPPSS